MFRVYPVWQHLIFRYGVWTSMITSSFRKFTRLSDIKEMLVFQGTCLRPRTRYITSNSDSLDCQEKAATGLLISFDSGIILFTRIVLTLPINILAGMVPDAFVT